MPENDPTIDDRLKALDARIERLQQYLPPKPRVRRFGAPPRRLTPVGKVRVILILFASVGALSLLGDVGAIFFEPDERVFVAREDGKLQVWHDVRDYETATGKRWIELPPHERELVATYHGARRNLCLGAMTGHILFLVLSVVALRNLPTRPERAQPT